MEDSISFANSYENFLKLMELKGHEIQQKNGAACLKPMGEKRFIRLTDISSYYTKEFIGNQIEKGIQREISRGENRTSQLKQKPYSQMWRYRDEAARIVEV